MLNIRKRRIRARVQKLIEAERHAAKIELLDALNAVAEEWGKAQPRTAAMMGDIKLISNHMRMQIGTQIGRGDDPEARRAAFEEILNESILVALLGDLS